jgi:outer membrane protein
MDRRLVVSLASLAAWGLASGASSEEALPVRTLEECVEIALASHPTLGAAEAAVDAGRARVRQAWAGYLPELGASYTTRRSRGVSGGSRSTTGGTFVDATALDTTSLDAAGAAAAATDGGARKETITFHRTGVSLSQVLFDFGQNLDPIPAARSRSESLEADALRQRLHIVQSVKQSYFELLAARRLREVADETVRLTEAQLEQAQARLDVGLAPPIDVTRTQVQLAQAELDRVTARNNVSLAEQTLRNALGIEAALDFDIRDVLEVSPAAPREADALAAAYAARPEIASAEAQQAALEREIGALRKSYLPSLSASASYDGSGQDYPLETGWLVGATVNLSLLSGWRTAAQIAEARAQLRGLEREEAALRQDIALEMRRAVLAVGEAIERIGVSERGARHARENFDLAEGRDGAGVGDVIELTDAQRTRAVAAAEHVRALYTYQIAVAELERATGAPVP